MIDLPTGTVTFLFTDIEGSTRLWERAPDSMRRALARHDELIDTVVAAHAGVLVRPRGEGDSRFAVFGDAKDAVVAACEVQQALHAEPWPTPEPLRVRIALHTGEADVRDGDYYGSAVNRCARLRGAASGGQVLLSGTTVELTRDYLPQQAGLKALGSHRLKDLDTPQHVYQLLHPELPASYPPLRSASSLLETLPVRSTSLVGREREIAEIGGLLGTTRLLTLTGSGGVGKTRLALRCAADNVDAFPDGIFFVDLAPVTDPNLVTQAVATALGVLADPVRPLLTALLGVLRKREVLLILDNCEHLLAACADLAAHLLSTCPHLRLLATSREALLIDGEVTWRVPSLSLPGDDSRFPMHGDGQSEAAQLFAERAASALPGFALSEENWPAVADICRRLDGIPLALELAAARIRALSVEQIALRLSDRFRLLTSGDRTAQPRQQTLRGALDWSHELLTPPERQVFRRVSVFAGGWSVEAAESVCVSDGLESPDVFDLLSHLVEKSLVVAERGKGSAERYRLLETMRQYGEERLLEVDEAVTTRDRHAAWYLEWVEQAIPAAEGALQAVWCRRFDEELDNIRAAMDWSARSPEGVETTLRLGTALWFYWDLRGYLAEGRRRLDAALTTANAASARTRGNALRMSGFMAFLLGDHSAARQHFDECIPLLRQAEEPRKLPRALAFTGNARVLSNAGDAQGAALLEEALGPAVEVGDAQAVGFAYFGFGHLAAQRGDMTSAAEFFEASLAAARDTYSPWGIALPLFRLGHLALGRGDTTQAVLLLRESLAVRASADDRRGVALSLEVLGWASSAAGRLPEAVQLLSAADRLRQNSGLTLPEYLLPGHDRTVSGLRLGLGEKSFAMAWAEGRAMPSEEYVVSVLASFLATA